MPKARLLTSCCLVVLFGNSAAVASGLFVAAEAGYHRIVPVDPLFDKVLAGHRGSAVFGLGGGHETTFGGLLGVELSYLEFQPRQLSRYPGGSMPSTVRYLPVLGSLGLRVSVGARGALLLTAAGGVAREWQNSEFEPRRWNRSSWRSAFRLSAGVEHIGGHAGIGVRLGWLFLPAVATPQLLDEVSFGGFSIAGTLSFGRRMHATP